MILAAAWHAPPGTPRRGLGTEARARAIGNHLGASAFFFFFLLKEKVSSDFQMEMQFSYRDWLCQATSLRRSGP